MTRKKKTGFNNVTKRDLKKIKSVINEKSGVVSKKIFEVGDGNVNKEKRCRILKTLGKGMKAIKLSHFKTKRNVRNVG